MACAHQSVKRIGQMIRCFGNRIAMCVCLVCGLPCVWVALCVGALCVGGHAIYMSVYLDH